MQETQRKVKIKNNIVITGLTGNSKNATSVLKN